MPETRILVNRIARMFIVLGLSLTAVSWAQDEPPEEALSFQDSGELQKIPEKSTLPVCTPGGSYCTGYFSDLIDWIRYERSGRIRLAVTSSVQNAIGGYCNLFSTTQVIVPSSDLHADRLVTQITIAKSLGERFRLQWEPGPAPDNTCELALVIAPY